MSHKVKVEGMADKPVNTKFGNKLTYSFKGNDGQWYKMGFKKPTFGVGDEVEFEFNSGRYGNEVTAILGASGTGAAAPQPAARQFGGPRGVFPIPPTDAQRSIIRQNSLTNALKYVELHNAIKPVAVSTEDVIKVAKAFEAYSAGDLEAAAAKKAILKEEKKDD